MDDYEEKVDIIVKDVINQVSSNSITDDDLNDIRSYLKKKIDEKSYSISELNNIIRDLKQNINKKNFNKKDIKNAAKQAKRNNAKKINTFNPLNDLSGLSTSQKIKVIF